MEMANLVLKLLSTRNPSFLPPEPPQAENPPFVGLWGLGKQGLGFCGGAPRPADWAPCWPEWRHLGSGRTQGQGQGQES